MTYRAVIQYDVLLKSHDDFLNSLSENSFFNVHEVSHTPDVCIVSPVSRKLFAVSLLLLRKPTVLDEVLNVLQLDLGFSCFLQRFCSLVEIWFDVGDMEKREIPELIQPLVGKVADGIQREVPLVEHSRWNCADLICVARRAEVFPEIIAIAERVDILHLNFHPATATSIRLSEALSPSIGRGMYRKNDLLAWWRPVLGASYESVEMEGLVGVDREAK
jgi:hypothetical protein